ncbi:MAG: M14 family metallopeptidase [Saprospiraceae bacterium]|nr:M14 family metallopeptidase [Saprospiraceae bacterium]
MLRLLFCLFGLLTIHLPTPHAQSSVDIHYYLPDIPYNPAIPTPEAFLGYQVGDWHVSHDQLRFYMQELARRSNRITIEEYAYTYEQRPLLMLTITSPQNHARLDEILAQRQAIADPQVSSSVNFDEAPVVIYQGYSIHGNEPSGANAALLVAYYLAAGQSDEVNTLLDNAVVLLDPCFNPDGLHRFSTWVNSHKNQTLTSDPADREYDEAWPRGRTNHYWFDLNRDWLLLQHPESRGRVANYHKWKPNVLTDHHEMGTNSTFFFMPGIPSRTNPITPQRNQDLTAAIAEYHAEILDEIGSLYYTKESFDDFYVGKGSTYPDVNGGVGILFEQGSARGHVQESDNGLLTFQYAIRNQVRTSLSTQRAAIGLKNELQTFQRDFYATAITEARRDPVQGYLVGPGHDNSKGDAFVHNLLQHDIDVYVVNAQIDDVIYPYLIPVEQPQYRMIRAIFERQTAFEDSLFYDVSGWTLPLAYNMHHVPLSRQQFESYRARIQAPLTMIGGTHEVYHPRQRLVHSRSEYAYAMIWDDYFAPAAAYHMMKEGLRIKVAQKPFTSTIGDFPMMFTEGTILIPVQNQAVPPDEVHDIMVEAARIGQTGIWGLRTGLSTDGVDLGSRSFVTVLKPEVAILVGDGVSGYESGEMWHLFDTRYQIPVTKLVAGDVGRIDLSRYTAIIMVDGNYRSLGSTGNERIKEWVRDGGTLVLTRGAIQWASGQDLITVKRKSTGNGDDQSDQRPYASASADQGSRVIGGAIFEIELDLTHPIAYGYRESKLPVFRRGTAFYEPMENPYATPGRYTDTPLLSGYINDENLEAIRGSASIFIGGSGSGRVICFADNPSFRAYWWGTQKLVANAVFFGSSISGGTVARGGME